MPLPGPLENMYQAYFANPNTTPNRLSVLYLLRRDAAQCFGYNPNEYDETQNPQPNEAQFPLVLWPGAMTVFTGIDLLGKFLAGVDEGDQRPNGITNTHPDAWKYGVGGRFQEFAQQYLAATPQEADVLYQVRCAIAHSFSLWARRRDDGQEYSFALDRWDGNNLLRTRNNATTNDIEAIIYIYELHKRFQRGAVNFSADYYARLEASAAERTKFQALVDHYGFIGIAVATAFGW